MDSVAWSGPACCQVTCSLLTRTFVSSAAGSDSVQRWRSRPAEALLGPRHDEPGLGVQGEDHCCSQPTQCGRWNSEGKERHVEEKLGFDSSFMSNSWKLNIPAWIYKSALSDCSQCHVQVLRSGLTVQTSPRGRCCYGNVMMSVTMLLHLWRGILTHFLPAVSALKSLSAFVWPAKIKLETHFNHLVFFPFWSDFQKWISHFFYF